MMTDFDEVLERLVSDPSFQSALAADPDAALRDYTLSGEERDLLRAQLASGSGEDRAVESRTTKSGVVGLLGPVVSAIGVAAAGAGAQSFGSGASASHALGSAPGSGSFGSAPPGGPGGPGRGGEAFGAADEPTESFGVAGGPVEGVGPAVPSATVGAVPEAAGYRTRVDADGDGAWDPHTAYERSDGGVDIHVDIDGDGVTDFIGHDYDRDGLVDVGDYDTDGDATLDLRMYDDTGDGWLDRAAPIPADDESQGFGSAPPS